MPSYSSPHACPYLWRIPLGNNSEIILNDVDDDTNGITKVILGNIKEESSHKDPSTCPSLSSLISQIFQQKRNKTNPTIFIQNQTIIKQDEASNKSIKSPIEPLLQPNALLSNEIKSLLEAEAIKNKEILHHTKDRTHAFQTSSSRTLSNKNIQDTSLQYSLYEIVLGIEHSEIQPFRKKLIEINPLLYEVYPNTWRINLSPSLPLLNKEEEEEEGGKGEESSSNQIYLRLVPSQISTLIYKLTNPNYTLENLKNLIKERNSSPSSSSSSSPINYSSIDTIERDNDNKEALPLEFQTHLIGSTNIYPGSTTKPKFIFS